MSDKLAPGIYLADVLTHIANHVMDGGDVQTVGSWSATRRKNSSTNSRKGRGWDCGMLLEAYYGRERSGSPRMVSQSENLPPGTLI